VPSSVLKVIRDVTGQHYIISAIIAVPADTVVTVLNVDVSLIDLPRRGVLDDPTIQPHQYFQFSYLTGRKSTNVRSAEYRPKSSESPQNLFSHPELAREVLSVVSDFESRLMQMLDKSKAIESEEEHKRFALAVGYVVAQLGDSLLSPIYRRHKELVPDGLKGELLMA
jgi:hypothetical protein